MSNTLMTVAAGIVAINLGFLYIFSAVYEWSWFYEGRGWSPYYVIGHENTMALFKAFGALCYGCGFIFVSVTLIENAHWVALIGLVAHSAAMAWVGWTQHVAKR